MRPYKASAVPPVYQVWHGLYFKDGHWHEVRDADDQIIDFKTAKDAIKAAKGVVRATASK